MIDEHSVVTLTRECAENPSDRQTWQSARM